MRAPAVSSQAKKLEYFTFGFSPKWQTLEKSDDYRLWRGYTSSYKHTDAGRSEFFFNVLS